MTNTKGKLRDAAFILFTIGISWWGFSPYIKAALEKNDSLVVAETSSVRIENGQQIIHIVARGGYTPRNIEAKADMPTVLEFETSGYDCSAALRIPALDIQQYLNQTGLTQITIPAQEEGTTLQGLCGMGMYRFDIKFG